MKEKLLGGSKVNGSDYKVHIDGFNQLDVWTGKTQDSARNAYTGTSISFQVFFGLLWLTKSENTIEGCPRSDTPTIYLHGAIGVSVYFSVPVPV